MRYIMLKVDANADGTLSVLALHKLFQKGGKREAEWIDTKTAVTNTINPEECDFVSFEDESEAEELLESLESEIDNIAIFKVDAD